MQTKTPIEKAYVKFVNLQHHHRITMNNTNVVTTSSGPALLCRCLTTYGHWTSAVEEWNSSRCIRVIQSLGPEKCCLSAAVSVSSDSESRRYRSLFTHPVHRHFRCVIDPLMCWRPSSISGSLELKAFVYSTDRIEVMVVYGVLWGAWRVYSSATEKVFRAIPLIKEV